MEIKLLLTKPRRFGSEERPAEFCLLKGTAPEGVTGAQIHKAMLNSCVKVVEVDPPVKPQQPPTQNQGQGQNQNRR